MIVNIFLLFYLSSCDCSNVHESVREINYNSDDQNKISVILFYDNVEKTEENVESKEEEKKEMIENDIFDNDHSIPAKQEEKESDIPHKHELPLAISLLRQLLEVSCHEGACHTLYIMAVGASFAMLGNIMYNKIFVRRKKNTKMM